MVTVENQVFEETSTLAVESVLNQLPQFVPANTQFNTSDVFPSATSTPGISTVSLRGLGSNRTLVLVDGRRAQPANSTLVIDTNTIPSSALDSVEIITGGASAVYGADALAGVTNFKLKNNFEGIDLQFRSGITEHGDGEENRASMLMGANLANGRGNAMLGVEWTERGEVLTQDRDFYRAAFNDSNTNANTLARMNRFQYEPGIAGQPSQVAANGIFPERPTGYTVPRNTAFLFNDNATLFKQERQGPRLQRRHRGRRTLQDRPERHARREQLRHARIEPDEALLAVRQGQLRHQRSRRSVHDGELRQHHESAGAAALGRGRRLRRDDPVWQRHLWTVGRSERQHAARISRRAAPMASIARRWADARRLRPSRSRRSSPRC